MARYVHGLLRLTVAPPENAEYRLGRLPGGTSKATEVSTPRPGFMSSVSGSRPMAVKRQRSMRSAYIAFDRRPANCRLGCLCCFAAACPVKVEASD